MRKPRLREVSETSKELIRSLTLNNVSLKHVLWSMSNWIAPAIQSFEACPCPGGQSSRKGVTLFPPTVPPIPSCSPFTTVPGTGRSPTSRHTLLRLWHSVDTKRDTRLWKTSLIWFQTSDTDDTVERSTENVEVMEVHSVQCHGHAGDGLQRRWGMAGASVRAKNASTTLETMWEQCFHRRIGRVWLGRHMKCQDKKSGHGVCVQKFMSH